MPDKRKHRGPHPDDQALFAAPRHPALQAATSDYAWLLTRGYAERSALKLVGDRHRLTRRQRLAVWRSSCDDRALLRRRQTRMGLEQLPGRCLSIDGYNVLITVESALAGGLILIGRDGCYRDLASIHGSYRKVRETLPALDLIIDRLQHVQPSRVNWYLDRPVSNSGRLKALMAQRLHERLPPGVGTTWNIELLTSPDAALAQAPNVVASSDSFVLNHCQAWCDLAGAIIEEQVPEAWKVAMA